MRCSNIFFKRSKQRVIMTSRFMISRCSLSSTSHRLFGNPIFFIPKFERVQTLSDSLKPFHNHGLQLRQFTSNLENLDISEESTEQKCQPELSTERVRTDSVTKQSSSNLLHDDQFTDLNMTSEPFIIRHCGPNLDEIDAMLKLLNVESLDDLTNKVVPDDIRIKETQSLPEEIRGLEDEKRAIESLSKIASLSNIEKRVAIGQGYKNTTTPAVIRRLIFENPAWYSSYTPYQAEISQGRLEALLNYQTAVCELTGMEVSNASLLDEATAAAEAMLMLHKLAKHDAINVHIVGDFLDADCQNFDEGKEIDFSNVFGAIVQSPDTYGRLRDYTKLSESLHSKNAKLITAIDPLSLALIRPPSDYDADVVIGSSQSGNEPIMLRRLGLPMGCGGPHAGIFATRLAFIRQMPGRIVGTTKDANGTEGYRLTLQTREQHIRKEKATSNICTSQALLAIASSMYVLHHGAEGLKRLAIKCNRLTSLLCDHLKKKGLTIINEKCFFDTLTIRVNSNKRYRFIQRLVKYGFLVRSIDKELIGISIDETFELQEIQRLAEAILEVPLDDEDSNCYTQHDNHNNNPNIPEKFLRSDAFLQQKIFNMCRSETNLMRYIRYLERKDLALDRSMIPLGSCTMKLNPSIAMYPIFWPHFSQVHPFAPLKYKAGVIELERQLSAALCSLTGFAGCSLQPNSGAAGEYAGLHAIRSFQDRIGQGHRNICLIPKSAHGTNPASANLAGLQVKGIDLETNQSGSIDIGHLRKLIDENKDCISCAMVTYPSTFGVFDDNIKELALRICAMVHEAGAQVYIDGANMNAQMGLTSPALIGGDVCHLNLHKTLSIPHGGGGPGAGPICVKEHLIPFLPKAATDLQIDPKEAVVSGGPYGSAMIFPISWMLIALLGMKSLKRCSQLAILNANYMAFQLKSDYTIKYVGRNGFCAHEFILDVSTFKESAGITEEDIAKRLMDFGFHAPTMSWPVHSSLMIEPTESENKDELDRFCDSMKRIRQEVKRIEDGIWPRDNNPIKNAPHTIDHVITSYWDRPYTKEEAAFPCAWIKARGKYWPPIGRLNNKYGDMNLNCSCSDVSSYET